MSLVAYEDSESEEESNTGLKSKQTVKISIPALSQDSDDDEPASKRVKSTSEQNKSGLLSILPPPKEKPNKVLTFVPNVIKNKPKAGIKKTSAPAETKKIKKQEINTKEDSDSETSDDEIVTDFDEELWKQIVCPPKPKAAYSLPPESVIPENKPVEIAPEASKPYEGLNNEAFKELVGKGKEKAENIKLIDIHEDEIRPDKQDWLKSLTDPNYAPKKEEEDPVNDTCKRKHHITYLAQQAKANELELQNQWASNRFARKQTQAKYGF